MKKGLSLYLSALSLLLFIGANSAGCTPYKTLGTEEFRQAVADTLVQLADVRTPEEYAVFHIPGAVNIDYKGEHFLDSALVNLSKERPVAVYCRGGVRSVAAAKILAKAGFKDILNLEGGITKWKEDGGTVCDEVDYIVFNEDTVPDFVFELYDPSTRYPEGYMGGGRSTSPSLSMEDLRGKVVMLQFTASWCSVCRREMPHIESEIYQRWKDRDDFYLVGIDRDEPFEKIARFREVTGVTYPFAFDPECRIFDKFALHDSGITRNVLIDKDGKIVFRTRLYDEKEFSELVAKIEELLK